ncbi:MAG: SpoIIE family protein phosphatase [Clostridia bacterium]|nr:SpoIIE family protein phosphatase [Clostridia bacterium]
MKNQRKKKLSNKLLLGLMLFALITCITTSVFVGWYSRSTEMAEYQETTYTYARAASQFIDGDTIAGYITPVGTDENGEPIYQTDDYYGEVMDYLAAMQSECENMKYYYVFVPYEDDLIYVWDAITAEDYCELGYREEYMDGGKEAVAMIYNRNPVEKISEYHDDTYGWIACAYYPVYNSAGDPVAVVGVDLSMEGVTHKILVNVMTIILTMVGTTVIGIWICYIATKRVLVRPIEKLNTATKVLVENLDKTDADRSFDLKINTKDELEELVNSFGKMNTDLHAYISQLSTVTAEKERIGAELNIATQIQADMLPRIFPPFPERKEFDLYASMTPAKEVGGDFYDFFLVDDDHIALVMADVSGKGVPAALFMVIAKTLIKNRAQLGESPAEILRHVNDQLCEGNEAELFVTVWLAVIELSTGRGLAANAGHEHPALRRADGQYELIKYRHSPAVATMEGTRFSEHEFELHPGDSLFVYTDGVTEATNSNNELFGNDRLLASLNTVAGACPKLLLENVRAGIDGFVGEAPQFDDITMLGFCYYGKEPEKVKELTIAAKTENLDEVLAFVDSHLDENICSPKVKMQIDVAVEELYVNIAHYAYNPEVGPATVRVEVEEDPPAVAITFIDHGVPYDPLAKADPDITLSAEERQIGGLGIFMVKKSMDNIDYEYRDGQNILRIKKNM